MLKFRSIQKTLTFFISQKAILLGLSLFLIPVIYSQVGVNTTTPKATLEVVGKPTETNITDGVIAPRLKRSELISKTAYSTDQIGAIIYVLDLSGTVNSKTDKITEIGYYYFDGSNWESMNNQTVFNYGDVKQGFQSADHGGWVKLDGRSVSSLSSNQQTRASNLGFTTNLPNATNAFLVQNGSTLGNVSGSNTKTILQSDLPNVTLTGSTSTDGSHNHGFSVDSSPWATGGTSVSNVTNRNNASTSNAGSHSHTVTTSSINGGVTQTKLNITPQSLSVNTFVYLGE